MQAGRNMSARQVFAVKNWSKGDRKGQLGNQLPPVKNCEAVEELVLC
jgi:hypothetical protein